jgi:hypothetical protein
MFGVLMSEQRKPTSFQPRSSATMQTMFGFVVPAAFDAALPPHASAMSACGRLHPHPGQTRFQRVTTVDKAIDGEAVQGRGPGPLHGPNSADGEAPQ